MNFIEYSPLALRTAKPLTHQDQVDHALLGLVTEVGELSACVKNHTVYGKDLDKVNMMEEVSDIFWYLNLYLVEAGIGGRVVDVAVEEVSQKHVLVVAELKAATFALAGLAGTLSITTTEERGTDDVEVVKIFAGLLGTFLVLSGYTLSQALEHNIDKLALRYGDKYSDYKALNRDTAAERVVLEG
jgi:NTP pyrophosphatase (non-canonical NTP hydrolase)